jgi:hypothetical protein
MPDLVAGESRAQRVAFALRPKRAHPLLPRPIRVGLCVESPSMNFSDRREVEVNVVAPGATHPRTFVAWIAAAPGSDAPARSRDALHLGLLRSRRAARRVSG